VATCAAVAVNCAVPCPAVTTTLAGTVKLALLLLSGTVNPPVEAFAVKVTEQVDVPEANVVGVQLKLESETLGVTGIEVVPEIPEPGIELPFGSETTTFVI
jgi:hypothetical protein